jgi:hypothetical protein
MGSDLQGKLRERASSSSSSSSIIIDATDGGNYWS